MKYTIDVTQEDIDSTTEFHSTDNCAIAKALRRAIPNQYTCVVTSYVEIGDKEILLPEEAVEWNRYVTNGFKFLGKPPDRSQVKPITFEIDTDNIYQRGTVHDSIDA